MGRVERRVIAYSPRRHFLPFHNRAQRHAVIVAHRRAGKTVGCINDLIRRAWECRKPQPRCAYIAPWFNQAKDVAWTYLKHFAEPLLAAPPNETELRVDLLNGARIRLYGADNPDRLRGIYLDHVVLDEYADMAPSVWGAVVRPLLADRQGGATFIGTPKGRNAFFDMWEKAGTDSGWFRAMLRASETGLIPAEELEAARRDMTPEQYDQEFECSFDAAILGAYFGKEMADLDRLGRLCEVEFEPSLPVHTAWDLGMHDSMVLWFFQPIVGGINVGDFYQNHGLKIGHYMDVIRSKGYPAGEDFVPHDAKVREMISGRARIEEMIDLGASMGRRPHLVPDHKREDGINAARLILPRCRFHASKCKDGIEALRQYRRKYDEKKRTFLNEPEHNWASHPADGFRYLSVAAYELAPPAPPKPEYDFNNQRLADLIGDPTRKVPQVRIRA